MWQEWGPWSECSTSCGKGFNFRARACGEPAFGGNDTCDGNSTESRECLTSHCPGYDPEVSESRFFNLETRMRVSRIQSRSSRPDREFLTLTLRLRAETEKKFPPISGIETRSRFIIFTLRHRDENENSLDLILFFETIPRILKVAIFP